MFHKGPSKDRGSTKLAISNIILVANAFIWYLIAFNTLKSLLSQQNATSADTLMVLGSNTGAIAIAGLIGTLIVGKALKHRRFLYLWISSGIILSLLPLVFNETNITTLMVLSLIFGVYFGLGMPATMGYSSGFTKVENRAKIGGFTFLIVGITFAFTSVLAQTSLIVISSILVVLRIIGILTLFSINGKESASRFLVKDNEKQVKYSHIIFNKSFILYFIPWLMFTLINYTTIPIQAQIYGNPETYTFLAEMEFIITAIVALISGFIADKIGRKRLSIIGFILLGIGYAVIGLASANIPIDAAGTATLENTSILLIGGIAFTVIDGIAWGIFYVLFVFTLWGDLANNKWSDKFYFLGVLPYVSAYLIQLMFTPLLSEISFITVFSFASVFLFIAVLPLIYAPETLPDKLMKDRELKSYIENAKKKATKVKHKNKHHKEETEPEENSAEYEEAKKLAEKYY